MRYLKHGKDNMGEIGEQTDVVKFRVGDLVYAEFGDGYQFKGVIVKHNKMYSVMGACGDPLSSLKTLYKILDYKCVTEEIINEIHGSLTIVEPKKMTLAEIEKALGYEIEVVEG